MNIKTISNISLISIYLSPISNILIIFSAFFDKRYNAIRLLGLSSGIVNFSCKYILNNTEENCASKYRTFKRDSSSANRFKMIYMNILIDMKNNVTQPKAVKINKKYFQIYSSNMDEKKNVLCITTFKNFNSYSLLYQSLFIYSYYGITDVYIYLSDSYLDMKMFEKLKKIKIHIISIKNDSLFNSAFYFGQILKYNDCLYRNMYSSNYIIYTDIDELIVINKVNRVDDLLIKLDQGDIYYFRSTLCPTTSNIENKRFHIIKDINLNETCNCCLLKSYYHRKYLIKSPYKFIKINIHYTDYFIKKVKHIYVKVNYAYIHHSRISTYLLMNHCEKWFYDINLKKVFSYAL